MKRNLLFVILILSATCLFFLLTFLKTTHDFEQNQNAFETQYTTLEANQLDLLDEKTSCDEQLEIEQQERYPPIITCENDIITDTKNAFANQLGIAFFSQLDNHYDLAVLLAVEASKVSDTPTTRSVLLHALQANPHLKAIMPNNNWGWAESVAFSPNGRYLAAGYSGGQVTLYDISSEPFSHQPLHGLIEQSGEGSGFTQITFSPDSQFIAGINPIQSTDENESSHIVIWDTNTSEIVSTGSEYTHDIAFLADGMHVISVDAESIVNWKIVPGKNLEEVSRFNVSSQYPHQTQFAVHPNTNLLAIGQYNGEIDLWNPITGEHLKSFTPLSSKNIYDIAFHPNGSILAIHTSDAIYLWNLEQEQLIGQPISALSFPIEFSSDGQNLLVVNPGQSFQLIDIETQEPQTDSLRHWGNSRMLTDVALHPNGRFIASSYQSGRVILWDTQTTFKLGTTISTNFSPSSFLNDKTIVTIGPNSALAFWDIDSSQILTETTGFEGVNFIAFIQDYTIAATHVFTNNVSTISLLNPLTNQLIIPPITQTIYVNSFALSPNGTVLATGDLDGVLKLWDTATGTLIKEPILDHTNRINTIVFSPDGNTIASSGGDQIFVRSVSSHQLIFPSISADVEEISFHPYKNMIIGIKGMIGGSDRETFLWDSTDGSYLGKLGTSDEFVDTEFDSRGLFVARSHLEIIHYGGRLPFLTLHDSTTMQQIGPDFEYYWGPIFNQPGSILATVRRNASNESELALWHMDIDYWREQACLTVNRNMSEIEWARYFGSKPYQKTCSNLP